MGVINSPMLCTEAKGKMSGVLLDHFHETGSLSEPGTGWPANPVLSSLCRLLLPTLLGLLGICSYAQLLYGCLRSNSHLLPSLKTGPPPQPFSCLHRIQYGLVA